jgi:hypothetical protein
MHKVEMHMIKQQLNMLMFLPVLKAETTVADRKKEVTKGVHQHMILLPLR